MGKRRQACWIVALATAYAIVVQATMAGFAAAAAFNADAAAALCVTGANGGDSGDSHHRAPHTGDDCCLAGGCGGGLATVEPASTLVPAPNRVQSHVAVFYEVAWRWPSERPRSSRAPPV